MCREYCIPTYMQLWEDATLNNYINQQNNAETCAVSRTSFNCTYLLSSVGVIPGVRMGTCGLLVTATTCVEWPLQPATLTPNSSHRPFNYRHTFIPSAIFHLFNIIIGTHNARSNYTEYELSIFRYLLIPPDRYKHCI